jgi:hypothetical protein
MPELLVPELVENPFRELYRGLIVTSMLHSVEEQEAHSRDRRRRRRTLRLERAAAELGAVVAGTPAKVVVPSPSLPDPVVEATPAPAITPVSARLEPPAPVAAPAPAIEAEPPTPAEAIVLPMTVSGEPFIGRGVRRAAVAVWVLTAVVLVSNTVVFGFGSWATGAADLALITLTLVWFATAIADAGLSRRS